MPVKRARRRSESWHRKGRPVSSRVPLGTPLHMVKYRKKFPPQLHKMEGGSLYQVWAEVEYGQEIPSVIKPAKDFPEATRIAKELGEVYPHVYILKTPEAWSLYRGGKQLEPLFAVIETDPNNIASKLMHENAQILNRMGIQGGSDLYPYLGAPKERWDRYQKAVKQMLERLGYRESRKVPWKARDILENENAHALNYALDLTKIGEPSPTYEEGRYGVKPKAFFSREEYFKHMRSP